MQKPLLLVLACMLVFASCDLAKMNENKKDPTDVKAAPLFSGAVVSLGTFMHNPDVNIQDFMFMAQYWTMTLYQSETQYDLNQRQVPSEIWEDYYTDILIDLKQAQEKLRANETMDPAVKKNKIASIDVIQVLAYSQLVNIFGGVPFTDALNPADTQPSYDTGKMIYSSIIDSLNTAINNFDPNAAGFSASADILYNGDVSKWIKFANSLKLRLGMMLADVNKAKATKVVKSAIKSGQLIMSNAENAMIPFTSTFPTTNPVWENVINSGRHDYLPAKPLVSRMNDLNDPRRMELFTTDNGGTAPGYTGGTYGTKNDFNQFSHLSDKVLAKGRDGMIFGAPEVQFLLAEAKARNIPTPGIGGTAASHYKDAITADMKFWGVSASDISDYLAQSSVAYNSNNWRKSIGIQKWIALYGQYLQGWTSYRRLDYPKLDAPAGAHEGIQIVPVRYFYPISEYRFNGKQVKEAVQQLGVPEDKYTTALFWDTRGPGKR